MSDRQTDRDIDRQVEQEGKEIEEDIEQARTELTEIQRRTEQLEAIISRALRADLREMFQANNLLHDIRDTKQEAITLSRKINELNKTLKELSKKTQKRFFKGVSLWHLNFTGSYGKTKFPEQLS